MFTNHAYHSLKSVNLLPPRSDYIGINYPPLEGYHISPIVVQCYVQTPFHCKPSSFAISSFFSFLYVPIGTCFYPYMSSQVVP